MSMTFTVRGTGERLHADQARVIVAGYTGADPAAVQHHIDELAAIGVAPPESVPAFYPMPAGVLTQDATISVTGAGTSGEVEPVLLRLSGRLFLGVGSDHTDRDLERDSVARSKAVCPKPVGRAVVEIPSGGLGWHAITLRSVVDGATYQEGRMTALLPPTEVLERYERSGHHDDGGDLVLFGGTLPLLTGSFTFGRDWELSLQVPGHEPLTHTYTVTTDS